MLVAALTPATEQPTAPPRHPSQRACSRLAMLVRFCSAIRISIEGAARVAPRPRTAAPLGAEAGAAGVTSGAAPAPCVLLSHALYHSTIWCRWSPRHQASGQKMVACSSDHSATWPCRPGRRPTAPPHAPACRCWSCRPQRRRAGRRRTAPAGSAGGGWAGRGEARQVITAGLRARSCSQRHGLLPRLHGTSTLPALGLPSSAHQTARCSSSRRPRAGRWCWRTPPAAAPAGPGTR